MKKEIIPKGLRKEVADRAKDRCEYCLMPSALATYKLQVDHIIPEKQKGPTTSDNLALACKPCNCKKGYSVVRYYYESSKAVMLYNPRKQAWADHFELLNSGEIKCLTETGTATAEVLDFNIQARIEFRERMISNGLLDLREGPPG